MSGEIERLCEQPAAERFDLLPIDFRGEITVCERRDGQCRRHQHVVLAEEATMPSYTFVRVTSARLYSRVDTGVALEDRLDRHRAKLLPIGTVRVKPLTLEGVEQGLPEDLRERVKRIEDLVAVAIDVGIDVLDRGAGRLQRRHGLADDLTDFGINWIEPEIGTVRDPKIVDRALRGRDVVGLVGRKAERIAGVGPAITSSINAASSTVRAIGPVCGRTVCGPNTRSGGPHAERARTRA